MKNRIIKERDLSEVAKVISSNMENNLTKVQDVLDLDFDEILEVINKYDDDEKDKICSIMINTELEKLKVLNIEQFKSVARDVDEITDYYTSKRKDFDVVIEEGDTVANDILFKLIGKNGRKLTLPINISIIKEYCFSTELKEEQFYETLVWIVLRYVAISRCLTFKKWIEEDEKDKTSKKKN